MNNLRLFYSENTCQVPYEKDNLCIYLRESEQGSAPVHSYGNAYSIMTSIQDF